jgi:hypothetical protein
MTDHLRGNFSERRMGQKAVVLSVVFEETTTFDE